MTIAISVVCRTVMPIHLASYLFIYFLFDGYPFQICGYQESNLSGRKFDSSIFGLGLGLMFTINRDSLGFKHKLYLF